MNNSQPRPKLGKIISTGISYNLHLFDSPHFRFELQTASIRFIFNEAKKRPPWGQLLNKHQYLLSNLYNESQIIAKAGQ
jgi:hypothetical protein